MRFLNRGLAACFIALTLSAPSIAQDIQPTPPVYPVEAFAHLPIVSSPSLSPDGKSIAYLTAHKTGRNMLIAHPIGGMTKNRTIVVQHQKNADVTDFVWANDERILVTFSLYGINDAYIGRKIEQTRLISSGFDGKTFNLVKPSREQERKARDPATHITARRPQGVLAQRQSNIIDMLYADPERILLAVDEDVDGDPDIRSIEVSTGVFKTVKTGREDILRWLTNGAGDPVLGYGTHKVRPHLFLDKSVSEIWSYDAIYELLDNGSTPRDIHEDGKSAYFYTTNQSGRSALARFDLTNGDFISWVYTNPNYDMTRYVRSKITNRIIGAHYSDTVSRQVFVDGLEQKILKAANQALPGTNNQIISSDRAGKLFLILSQAPRKTPRLYAFDMRAKALTIFTAPYEQIKDEHVASVEKHVVKMRDGLEIEVYVTMPIGRGAKNLPAIMLPHGGPASRDTADFDIWAQFFANRGYVVLQPNFRGSTGYGRKFSSLSDEAWGRGMQDDVTDSTQWAIDSGLIDARRICIVGGSYGGYAALMGAVKTPDLFQCAISMNGVADLPMMWTKDGNFIGGKEWRKGIGENRAELKDISPYHRAAEIKIPVLLVAAKDDARVDFRHSKKMYRKLRKLKQPAEYVELKSGGHSVDVNDERVKWFAAMGTFVDEALAPQ